MYHIVFLSGCHSQSVGVQGTKEPSKMKETFKRPVDGYFIILWQLCHSQGRQLENSGCMIPATLPVLFFK